MSGKHFFPTKCQECISDENVLGNKSASNRSHSKIAAKKPEQSHKHNTDSDFHLSTECTGFEKYNSKTDVSQF